MNSSDTQERFRRGAADAGQFFTYISEFVGFTEHHAATIRETRFIIEKHIPSIVSGFYVRLLRFPATRRLFLKPDGSIDQEYLEMRMRHQASFWRRAASGEYDEDFMRFLDYVGRAHTSKGADPNIYIPERYVIGMVGYVGLRIAEALDTELDAVDHGLADRGMRAWNLFLIVILEMLARSYGQPKDEEAFKGRHEIDETAMMRLAVDTYERSLGIAPRIEYQDVYVAREEEIPLGERRIIEVKGVSIGVFHHGDAWVALQNSCLHRGGPVCEGTLEGDTLTCPWHGYQYDVCSGELLLDRAAQLESFPVEIRDGDVYVRLRTLVRPPVSLPQEEVLAATGELDEAVSIRENEFWIADLPAGGIIEVDVDGEPVAVYNLDGDLYATHARCTHMGGPLDQGRLDGFNVICPWHDSCFDVRTGDATCGPANQPVKTFQVLIEGEIGRVSRP